MLPYKDFKIENFQNLTLSKDNKGRIFYNEIFTFDIETSSAFITSDNQLMQFDFTKSKEYYKDFEKISFMYIWQFGINDTVFFGRTWQELKEFFMFVTELLPEKKIVYVHNLAYEFHFMLNIFEREQELKEFARKPHKVMKFELQDYNMLFKCSYILGGMSLEKLAENYKLPVKKLVGNLDYTKIRYHTTKLSKKELQYCENDLLVMYHYLLMHKKKYKYMHNIPLTQTGEVRREVKNLVKNDNNYYRKVWQQQPKDFKELQLLTQIFGGGYTHANAVNCNEIIENVKSKDLASSYPCVMCCEKFPCTSFFPLRNLDIEEHRKKIESHAFIFELKFKEIRSKKFNNYISSSKCYSKIKVVEDNGRVVQAIQLQIKVNEIDFQIIEKCYEWEEMEVVKVFTAKKSYLDKKIVQYILELFANKTSLKGIEENDDLYMKSKQYINSLFGMCVTNNVTDEVVFNNLEWKIEELTEEKANKILKKMSKSRNTFLNFSWGVWVTSYARRNLWQGILEIDSDVIYCDTDSIKYIGDYEYFFEEYNKNIIEKLVCSVTNLGIDISMLYPKDIHGKVHYLGIWESEKSYKKFKTMGAKKYIGEYEDGKRVLTVSGVNKKAVKQIQDISDFKEGHIFSYENSGRLIMTYLDNQQSVNVYDDLGNLIKLDCKFGIHAQPTTYELGISESYDDYLTSLNNQSSIISEIRKGV